MNEFIDDTVGEYMNIKKTKENDKWLAPVAQQSAIREVNIYIHNHITKSTPRGLKNEQVKIQSYLR